MVKGFCVVLKYEACEHCHYTGLGKSQQIHLQLFISCVLPPGMRNLGLTSPYIPKGNPPSYSPQSSPPSPLGRRHPQGKLLSPVSLGTRGQGWGLKGICMPFSGSRRNLFLMSSLPCSEPCTEKSKNIIIHTHTKSLLRNCSVSNTCDFIIMLQL